VFCAYCGEDHDETVAFTDEHVVPYAIGGSNAFTIRVCRPSNNALGGKVDKPFAETFVVQTKRFLLGLEGTHKTAPTLDLSGTKEMDGRQVGVTYRITKESKRLKISSPTVMKVTTPDGERWTASGDPTDVLRILKGKLVNLNAQGKLMKDADGSVLKLTDLDALAKNRIETLEPGILTTVRFDLLQFARFFAKLALPTGYFVFGESFSRSLHANVLRKATHAEVASEVNIQGAQVWPNIRAVEPVLALFRKENSHILGILPMEPPVFFANLFAYIGAIIPLGEYKESMMSSTYYSGRVFQIDLPSRAFHDQTFDQCASTLWAERREKRG
jgi:hypothetical protein